MHNWLKWSCIINDDWRYFDGFDFLMQIFELFKGLDGIMVVRL